MRSFETGSFQPELVGDDRTPNQADGHVYGHSHANKSTKTLFGIAVLIVASVLFYELGSNAVGSVTSPVGAHRMAHFNR